MKSLLSLHFSVEISTFSLLFYCNLYFLFTFLLPSLLPLYFSIAISTVSLLFSRNLYFWTLFSRNLYFWALSSRNLYFWALFSRNLYFWALSSRNLYFWALFSRNLYFWALFSRNLYFWALFSRNLYFWALFSRNLYLSADFLTFKLAHCPTPATHTVTSVALPNNTTTPLPTQRNLQTTIIRRLANLQLHSPIIRRCHLPPNHICISIIVRKAILPCFPQYNCAHQNFKEKLCPELDGPRAATAPQPRRNPRLILGIAFLWNFGVRSYIGGSKAGSLFAI